ncbi:hypothetical protein U8527_08140 [Kordia algicida OT-1]|uniref:Uncharacterized protein n=1 Tax=Kordia algicida OT-1 TaxID=391587 RepID=A9E673_9FLAO|nr:hypothetical protein [Kordia algicida]EDP94983.1 hypothetical protein KAOT1_01569 [Kordia algicida OT-1]
MKKLIIILLFVIPGFLCSQIKDAIGTVYYQQNNSIYTIFSNQKNTLIGQKGIEYREGKTASNVAKVFGSLYYPEAIPFM